MKNFLQPFFRQRIIKRSLDKTLPSIVLEFEALSRKFTLSLTMKNDVLSPDLQVFTADDSNEQVLQDIRGIELYSGYEMYDPGSFASASWLDTDLQVLSIYTTQDVYYFERGLRMDDKLAVIGYRASDRDNTTERYVCDACKDTEDHRANATRASSKGRWHGIHEHNQQKAKSKQNQDMSYKGKRKREGSSKSKREDDLNNRCSLVFLADYRFYSIMGSSNVRQTTNILVHTAERINQIFIQSDFNGYRGYGFVLEKIVIYDKPHIRKPGDPPHFNEDIIRTSSPELLAPLTDAWSTSLYCVVHLLTAQLTGKAAGAAHLSGACARVGNVGFSSHIFSETPLRRLTSFDSDLILAHELAHNLGAIHDPDTPECRPRGNFYLMYYQHIFLKLYSNHRKFSPCSKTAIHDHIRRTKKSGKCWKAQGKQDCGNHIMEGNEECDSGPQSVLSLDPCCGSDCKLRINAQCSDKNGECCHNCTLDPFLQVCSGDSELYDCYDTSTCTGMDPFCSPSLFKEDGSPCRFEGSCQNGLCLTVCEANMLESCMCTDPANVCKWCCRDNANATCEPFQSENGTLDLPNYMPCIKGHCLDTVCEAYIQYDDKYFSVVHFVTSFELKKNITMAVMFITLLFWVPVCIFIECHEATRKVSSVDSEHYSLHSQLHERSALTKGPASKSSGLAEFPEIRGITDNVMAKKSESDMSISTEKDAGLVAGEIKSKSNSKLVVTRVSKKRSSEEGSVSISVSKGKGKKPVLDIKRDDMLPRSAV